MAEPHEVLGIPEDASAEEARRAFRVLAQIYHPDRYAEASQEVQFEVIRRMQEVNWAYEERREGGNTVFWDTEGWTNGLRGELTSALLDAGIPHRWDREELTVLLRYEETVDSILDHRYGA